MQQPPVSYEVLGGLNTGACMAEGVHLALPKEGERSVSY